MDDSAVRQRRYRAHRDGDHSLCRAGCGARLRVATDGDPPGGLAAAVAGEFPEADVMSLAIATRLAELACEGRGSTAVAALRALGELVAYQRAGVRRR